MSSESEKMKKLVRFKEKVEQKIEELKSQLEEHQLMLEATKSILLEKGFKKAEIPETYTEEGIPIKEEAATEPLGIEYERVIPLKAATGELLANLHVDEDSLRVVPVEDLEFDVDTPPFRQFLVERVLTKMEEKDYELVESGKLAPEKVFSYSIIEDDNRLQELTIENFGNKRLRELKSSIRWTLEKMYEKTQES